MVKHIGLSRKNILPVQQKILPAIKLHQKGIGAGNIQEGQPAFQTLIDQVLYSLTVRHIPAVDDQQPLLSDADLVGFEDEAQNIIVFSLVNIKCRSHCLKKLHLLPGDLGTERDEVHQLCQHIYLLLLLKLLIYLLTDGKDPHCCQRGALPVPDAVFRNNIRIVLPEIFIKHYQVFCHLLVVQVF